MVQIRCPIAVPEHNFWEQLTLNQILGKYKLSHRYRIEHRFQGVLVSDESGNYYIEGHDFANRFRYRFSLKRDLTSVWFINTFDELWINMDDNLSPKSFDRNWFYAALGVHISPHANMQLGYMHQWIKKANDLFERHNTMTIVFQSDF